MFDRCKRMSCTQSNWWAPSPITGLTTCVIFMTLPNPHMGLGWSRYRLNHPAGTRMTIIHRFHCIVLGLYRPIRAGQTWSVRCGNHRSCVSATEIVGMLRSVKRALLLAAVFASFRKSSSNALTVYFNDMDRAKCRLQIEGVSVTVRGLAVNQPELPVLASAAATHGRWWSDR